MSLLNVLIIALLWAAAGFAWGWASRRNEIIRLRDDHAREKAAWELERIIWSRHGEPTLDRRHGFPCDGVPKVGRCPSGNFTCEMQGCVLNAQHAKIIRSMSYPETSA